MIDQRSARAGASNEPPVVVYGMPALIFIASTAQCVIMKYETQLAATPVPAQVHSVVVVQHDDAVGASGIALGDEPGRVHVGLDATGLQPLPQQAFGHRRPADVARAHEQDVDGLQTTGG